MFVYHTVMFWDRISITDVTNNIVRGVVIKMNTWNEECVLIMLMKFCENSPYFVHDN